MYEFLTENDCYEKYGDNICNICVELANIMSYYNSDDGSIELSLTVENGVVYQCYPDELPNNCKYAEIWLDYCSSPMFIVNSVIDAYNQLVDIADRLPFIAGEFNRQLYITF